MKIDRFWSVVAHGELNEFGLDQILDDKIIPSDSVVSTSSSVDLFGLDYGDITEVFCYISKRQDLTFKIVTKRPKRMLNFFNFFLEHYDAIPNTELTNAVNTIHKNCHFEVLVENQATANNRIPKLLKLRKIFGKNGNKLRLGVRYSSTDGIDLKPYILGLSHVVLDGEEISVFDTDEFQEVDFEMNK